MKTIIETFLLVFFSISAYSQQAVTSGGSTIINGNYSFTHTIGEVLQNFEDSGQINIKNGIIQLNKEFETNVNEVDYSKVTLFPSPASDVLKLNHEFSEIVDYKIYTMHGGLVRTGKIIKNEIPLTGLKSNTYLLQIECKDYIFSNLFIKI